MRIIRPTLITEEMLYSCDVPEDEHAEWSVATAYVDGSYVLKDHKIYKCLVDNTGFDPVVYSSTVPPKWLDCGFDNRWKMFDSLVGSQTSQADSLTVSIQPGIIDAIAFLDVDATEIMVTMTDPVDGVVYNATIDLIDKVVVDDAYTYFFSPIVTDDAAALLGVPPYSWATITVTVRNPGGTAKIGTLALGMQKFLGITLYEPSIGITDYSRKDVDDFGNYTVVQRAFSKRFSCEMRLPSAMVDDLQRTLAGYRASPVIWLGVDDGYSSLMIYGFYKSFEITIPGVHRSFCTLEVEGLS